MSPCVRVNVKQCLKVSIAQVDKPNTILMIISFFTSHSCETSNAPFILLDVDHDALHFYPDVLHCLSRSPMKCSVVACLCALLEGRELDPATPTDI